MDPAAEAHGGACVCLDDYLVQFPGDAATIARLVGSARGFRRYPGYGYAMAYFFGRASFFRGFYRNARFFFEVARAMAETTPVQTAHRRQRECDLCLIGSAAALFKLKEHAQALERLKGFRNFDDPELAGRYWGEFGWNLLRLQSYAEAEEAFREALRIRPSNVFARNGLGNALFELGRYEEARQEQFRVVQGHRAYGHGWCDLGHANLRLGRVEDAHFNFWRAYQCNIRTVAWFTGAGECLSRLGFPEEGHRLTSYAKLLKEGRSDDSVLSALAEAFEGVHDQLTGR